jgi:endogenous inhibitor of DNA gyrase (YacG/DUF329 family)
MLHEAIHTENAYRPSPHCPHCGTSMRFARSLPNFGARSPLQIFECPMCDLSVTRIADEAMEPAIAV